MNKAFFLPPFIVLSRCDGSFMSDMVSTGTIKELCIRMGGWQPLDLMERTTIMWTEYSDADKISMTCQVPDKWMQGNTKVTAMIENDNCYKARIIKVKVIFRQPPPPQ